MTKVKNSFQKIFEQAWALRVADKADAALSMANEGLRLAEKTNDLHGQALMLKIIAQVYHDKDELAEALTIYKQIEPLYIQLDMLPEQMHTLRHIGSLFLALGKAECAERCLVQVANHYESHDTAPLEAANAYHAYAQSLNARDQKDLGKTYSKRAKDIYASLGLSEGAAESNNTQYGL